LAIPVATDDVEEQAARWAACAVDGDLSPAQAVALDAWLAADRRHRGAYLRARAALYVIDNALTAPDVTHEPAIPVVDNDRSSLPLASAPCARWRPGRWGAIGGAALAASLVVTVGLGIPGLNPGAAPQQVAEGRVVTLRDGSVARLGRGGRIAFEMNDGIRKVVLIAGEARFDVAKDRNRPFVVRSGDVYAQATGTVYSVRRIGATGGSVRVDEGSVLVWSGDERDQAVLLRAGGSVTLEPAAPAPPRGVPLRSPAPTPPPPELAQISLDDVTIAAAAARFNRVNRTRIVIATPAIGKVRIVGLFRANDPERFARAAAAVSGAQVEVASDGSEIKLK
jgi:transmembrane sensor